MERRTYISIQRTTPSVYIPTGLRLHMGAEMGDTLSVTLNDDKSITVRLCEEVLSPHLEDDPMQGWTKCTPHVFEKYSHRHGTQTRCYFAPDDTCPVHLRKALCHLEIKEKRAAWKEDRSAAWIDDPDWITKAINSLQPHSPTPLIKLPTIIP